MVLNELGEKLTKTMQKLYRSHAMNKEMVADVIQEIAAALEEADVNQEILTQLKQRIQQKVIQRGSEENLQQYVTQLLTEEIVNILDPKTQPYQLNPHRPNVIAFYGLQGQGKTTTAAKYGSFYKKRGWKVGLVCCDTFRAGAFEQLKQNCAAVKLPYYGSYTEKDPSKLAFDGVAHFVKLGFNLIIIDTSGRHQQSEELLREMRLIDAAVKPDNRVFVVDASIGQAAFSQAQAFKKAVDIGSVILTKMDGSAKSGGALAAVSATRAPVIFIGTGEHFDAFEEFDPQRYAGKLLGFGDIRGLVENVQNSGIDHVKNAEVLTKMMEGEFSFESFRQQIDQVSKMGPMEKIIEMIPGMKEIAKVYGFDDEKEGTAAMGRWGHMFQSFTKKELQSSPVLLMKEGFERRVLRIAKGSGYTCERVRDMFKYAKMFSEQTKKFGQNQMGQNFKSMMQLQQVAAKSGAQTPEQLQQAMGGKINDKQMKMMQEMMAGKMPSGMGIPGLGNAGADPHAAVAQLRRMGLLPDDPNVIKKARKMASGKK